MPACSRPTTFETKELLARSIIEDVGLKFGTKVVEGSEYLADVTRGFVRVEVTLDGRTHVRLVLRHDAGSLTAHQRSVFSAVRRDDMNTHKSNFKFRESNPVKHNREQHPHNFAYRAGLIVGENF